jgi:hypothetical protein
MPGSPQAKQLKDSVNKKQAMLHVSQTSTSVVTSTTTTKHNSSAQNDDLFSNPVKINTGVKDSPPISQKKPVNSASANANSSVTKSSLSIKRHFIKTTSVSSSNTTQQPAPSKTSTPKVEIKKVKRQVSSERSESGGGSSSSNNKPKLEIERTNVRKSFRETLQSRMSEFEHPSIPKMTEDEVEEFATSLESEMFIFFNKDTRDKYKVKFRSLRFNLSDFKNKSLLERICAKKLSPKQLVKLPPAALASDELSKWREEENKHQLEIITKSELDALTQNKIVLKTHKGEEILETKTDAVNISLPDENDVESMIKGTVLNVDDPLGKYDRSTSLHASGQSINSPLSSPSISSSTGLKSDSHHSRSRSKSRGRDHHHHKSSSSKHKKSEHHRSRSNERHHHSSSSHRSNEKSRNREKSHERDRDRSKKTDDKRHHHRDKSRGSDKSSKSKDHQKAKDVKRHHQKEVGKEKVEIKPEQEDVDIVGKILDSMGVHLDCKPKQETASENQAAETAAELKTEVSSSSVKTAATTISTDPVNEHQLEIEIYSGNMYMAEVTKFDVRASIVSGNADDIAKNFAPQMEIVGRIEPKTVWDYLGKVRKLPGKELVVLRFSSSDQSAYFTLFSYLHSRQRYGVIKSPSPHIKDFYVITVEAGRSLPPVLLPIAGPGFVEGEEHKPDLLLGVILKILPESKV